VPQELAVGVVLPRRKELVGAHPLHRENVLHLEREIAEVLGVVALLAILLERLLCACVRAVVRVRVRWCVCGGACVMLVDGQELTTKEKEMKITLYSSEFLSSGVMAVLSFL
jgi:hypothetical protein